MSLCWSHLGAPTLKNLRLSLQVLMILASSKRSKSTRLLLWTALTVKVHRGQSKNTKAATSAH